MDKDTKIYLKSIAFAVIGTIVICLLMAWLSGCAMIKHTDKDGNVTEYWRLFEQSIGAGSIELPCGGKLTFEGQESKLPHVNISAKEIVIGGKEVVK